MADDEDILPAQVYDIIANIQDPEKPLSLEALNVVQEDLITVVYERDTRIPHIQICWVPTVPNCHLALTIALSIKAKLAKELKIGNIEDKSDLSKAKVTILVQ